MSHIVEFSITGLAGQKNVYKQVLNRHINIFFGLNGSGKTSLLKILHSAMSGDSRILRKVPFTRAEVKIYSIELDNIFTRVIDKLSITKEIETESESSEAVFFDGRYNQYDEYPEQSKVIGEGGSVNPYLYQWKYESEEDVKVKNWRHRYLPTSRLFLGYPTLVSQTTRPPSNVSSEELLDLSFAETLNQLWVNYYSAVLATVREAQEDGLVSILKAVLSGRKKSKTLMRKIDLKTAYDRVRRFLIRQGSPSILSSFEDFEKHYMENVQLRNVVNDIDKIEKRIADAVALRDKLESMIKDMFTGNKEVIFKDRTIDLVTADEKKISLSTLSSGEKHVLRIFIETLLAGSDSIMIDEPELSMHLDWQKTMIKTMRQLNPEVQLILATHSPEIMANISDDRIFRLCAD